MLNWLLAHPESMAHSRSSAAIFHLQSHTRFHWVTESQADGGYHDNTSQPMHRRRRGCCMFTDNQTKIFLNPFRYFSADIL